MKNWFRRSLILTLALILAAAPVLAEENAEIVPVLELPEPTKKGEYAVLSPAEDAYIGPHAKNYLTSRGEKSPHGYADPSITVNIGTGRIYKTNYMYARVKIYSPMQIRTMMASDSLKKEVTVMGHLLAKRVKAVVAINGILEADDMIAGPVVRQGVWLRPDGKASANREENWKRQTGVDTLVIDDAGDLVILESDTWGNILAKIEEMGSRAVNVLSFGPALVVNGEPRYGYKNRQMSSHRLAQRSAICQTGPLEYLLITSEGPEDPGSEGLKLDQFLDLIMTFPDVKTAYNLDGGSSTTLIFRKGTATWAKINCPKSGKKRALRDLIYFADAWLPSGKK